MREVLHYNPRLTKTQFLTTGFAEMKIILAIDVLKLCQEKHTTLSEKKSVSSARHKYVHKCTRPRSLHVHGALLYLRLISSIANYKATLTMLKVCYTTQFHVAVMHIANCTANLIPCVCTYVRTYKGYFTMHVTCTYMYHVTYMCTTYTCIYSRKENTCPARDIHIATEKVRVTEHPLAEALYQAQL